MKVSNQELRQIIIEEVQTALFEMEEPGELNEFFGLLKKKKREALKKVENKIAAYFINNAKGIAQAVVPEIPYDNDIIENALKASVEAGIKNNTKCATGCIMKFVTPDILKEEMTMVLEEDDLDEAINAAKVMMNNIRGLVDQLDGIVQSRPMLSSNEPLVREIEALRTAQDAVNATLVTIQGVQG